jgi:hypothetical protein
VKTLGYACGGYVTKGKTCCRRLVIPKEEVEQWVLEQIGRIVAGYLEAGAEEKLRETMEQELGGDGRFDESELARVRQRKADIEATIENLLDNITPTNRDYVNRWIEKLRDETRELEQQAETLLEQQGRDCQASELAQAALALAREVDRAAAFGTVDEKRTFVRAFLREIEFDPSARTGTPYFYAVPSVNGDTASDGKSSLRLRNDDARYAQKGTAPERGDSSLIMVAGACYNAIHHALEAVLVRRWRLPRQGRGQ